MLACSFFEPEGKAVLGGVQLELRAASSAPGQNGKGETQEMISVLAPCRAGNVTKE
jgi:hypothetical protein